MTPMGNFKVYREIIDVSFTCPLCGEHNTIDYTELKPLEINLEYELLRTKCRECKKEVNLKGCEYE